MKRVHNYKIGDKVDDMEIIDFEYNNYHQKQAVCRCVKCGRTKKCVENTLFRHSGTSHKACGQYLKTKDAKFYHTWVAMKQRIYNENYWASYRYKCRGLTCDYDNFIDFYDDMYLLLSPLFTSQLLSYQW